MSRSHTLTLAGSGYGCGFLIFGTRSLGYKVAYANLNFDSPQIYICILRGAYELLIPHINYSNKTSVDYITYNATSHIDSTYLPHTPGRITSFRWPACTVSLLYSAIVPGITAWLSAIVPGITAWLFSQCIGFH